MTDVTPATTSRSAAKHTPAGSTSGTNTIADGVVEKVAGIAARQVPGVQRRQQVRQHHMRASPGVHHRGAGRQ